VKKVNQRWIVHHGLGNNGAAYLEHLALCDPKRLARSCQNAQQLVRSCGPTEDPKPWFYGGLFSLATAEEVKQFLAGHAFTAAVVPCTRDTSEWQQFAETLSPATREHLEKLRVEIARVAEQRGET
jgi:hypothetical protein